MKRILLLTFLVLGSSILVAQPGGHDSTFNTFDNGTYGYGGNDFVSSNAVQSDGKVLIGGQFTSCNDTTRNGIARLYTEH